MNKIIDNSDNWKLVRKLTWEDYKMLGFKRCLNNRSLYKCSVCGDEQNFTLSEFNSKLIACKNGCHGSSIAGAIVIRGKDDIATTRPELVKYFAQKEDAHLYKQFSNKYTLFKCPVCGMEKECKISDVSKSGFKCSVCSDGFSYPEKVIASALSQSCVEFKTQVTFDWSGRKRYDFLINDNTLLEVHGSQHYDGGGVTRRSLVEEVENDKFKERLAIANGYKYIELDCRRSDIDYIKRSIENSNLNGMLNIDEVDWHMADKHGSNSVFHHCVEMYNYGFTINEISQMMGLNRATVYKYMTRGAKLEICNYNGKLESIKNGVVIGNISKSKSKAIVGTSIHDGSVILFASQNEAKRNGFHIGSINNCLKGKGKTSGGYTWKYSEKEEK